MKIPNLSIKQYLIVAGLICITLAGCNKYEKKGGFVYYESWNEGNGSSEKELTGVDYDKFKVLKYDSYAKDDSMVFYQGQRIINADAKTFEALGDYYAHDKYRGYYGGDSVKSSHGKTFRIIDAYYTTDGHDVFYMQDPLHMSHPNKFRYVFDSGEQKFERWTTDGSYYYINQFKVPSDDYSHMKLYKNSGGLSKDSKWVYYANHKLNYDEHGKRIIDTVDVASFTVTGYIECRDKYGCFNIFHGREKCEPRSNAN